MKEYFDEEEYLEDIYGDEIKVGDGFYKIKISLIDSWLLVHEKNFVQFAEDELDVKKEER
mgnify:FL=1